MKIFYYHIIFISILCSSCINSKKKVQEVNLYTQRHYSVDKKQFENFTNLTGIKVNVVKSNADELIERIKNEAKNCPADIFISVDAGKLYKAKKQNLLKKLNYSDFNFKLKDVLLDKDSCWIPLTYRARVIVFSKDRVSRDELSTYEDLSSSKWKNRLLIRSSSNSYNQAFLSSVIAHKGIENSLLWARGVVNNFARSPKGNDRDQVKAIYAGEGDLALINTYYLGLLLNSDKEEEVNAGKSVDIFFPNQNNDSGVHVNISGAGILKNSPNYDNALKLLNYLISGDAPKLYCNSSYEFPVNNDIQFNNLMQNWGTFLIDSIDLNLLGVYRDEAIKIFDKSGWK